MNLQHQSLGSSLRLQALDLDARTVERVWLSRLWHELSSGAMRVVDNFFTDERSYILLTPRLLPEPKPAAARFNLLQDVLCSSAQKLVAFERDVAPSTVASTAKSCLVFLGLSCNASRVPPLLLHAARAARFPDVDQQVPLSAWQHTSIPYAAVSALRPERRLRGVLSDAEFKVVRALLEGFSHTQIARERGTSPRTIANQLATAFRRMGVSSRGELLHRLGQTSAPGFAP
jgi:DNA-binding CsgD family transcriptional regulator